MASPRSFEEAMGSDDLDDDLNNGTARKRPRLSSQHPDEVSDDEVRMLTGKHVHD